MKKDSFEKKLAGYLTLSAAYLAAHPVDANAQILYTDVNPDVVIHNSFFNLDLNNDGVNDYKLQDISPTTSNSCYQHNWFEKANCLGQNKLVGNCYAASWGGSYGYFASNLLQGNLISSGQTFLTKPILEKYHSWYCYGSGVYNTSTGIFCVSGIDRFVGMKVINAGNSYYAWMRLDVTKGSIVLKDYAINLTPNAQIAAGYIPTCPKPVNLSSISINNHSQKLQWTIQGTSIGYKVRVRKTGTTVWSNIVVNSNIGFKQIYGLTPNTSYEWQVRSVCQQTPLVQSNFTTLQTFTTPLRLEDESSDANVTETQNELFIYPNPATNELFMITDETGVYEMKIINMIGQIVISEKINLLQEQSIIVNISKLPSGTYQAVVTGNNGNQIGRFVKE